MKINWGTSIVIAFVSFIAFILFFVVKTFTQKEYDYDLVSSQYYEDELKFQSTINDAENTKTLISKIVFQQKDEELKIIIPNPNNDELVGEFHFYRPSNDQLDFVKELNASQIEYVFTANELVKGRWNISVKWYYKKQPDKIFYQKEQLYF